MEESFWKRTWNHYREHRLGLAALLLFGAIALLGIYAPFLACSKPLVVVYDGTVYFPLFRYLFYSGFFTKRLDIFYNILMFTLPLFILWRRRPLAVAGLIMVQFGAFAYFGFVTPNDPASDPALNLARQQAWTKEAKPSWENELKFMNDYAKLNLVLRQSQRRDQDQRIQSQGEAYAQQERSEWLLQQVREQKAALRSSGIAENALPSDQELQDRILKETPQEVLADRLAMPTLWRVELLNEKKSIESQRKLLASDPENAQAKIDYITHKRAWIDNEMNKISFQVQPLLRSFHWEDDAGGERDLNRYVGWWDLSRVNRKDLVAGLIFGTRISLVVGVLAVLISLSIGVPIGAMAGYYGGKFDIVVSRLLEIWESMPVFFMLLMVVAILQSKSIFLVIAVVGIFGWTGFSRFLRGEFFKQRNLPYVEACRAMGFGDSRIIFIHVLPNAIPPILTLLPFAIMGAITSEAGLSFIGLGEEGSTSWGVLMDEGRQAFPGESYLLWPPAVLLTIMLVSIALIGDALRDAMDPKMRR